VQSRDSTLSAPNKNPAYLCCDNYLQTVSQKILKTSPQIALMTLICADIKGESSQGNFIRDHPRKSAVEIPDQYDQ